MSGAVGTRCPVEYLAASLQGNTTPFDTMLRLVLHLKRHFMASKLAHVSAVHPWSKVRTSFCHSLHFLDIQLCIVLDTNSGSS